MQQYDVICPNPECGEELELDADELDDVIECPECGAEFTGELEPAVPPATEGTVTLTLCPDDFEEEEDEEDDDDLEDDEGDD